MTIYQGCFLGRERERETQTDRQTDRQTEVQNESMLQWLHDSVANSEIIFTVCTGSWLLAACGVLDGVKATSNKNALRAGHPQNARPQVHWEMRARWVESTVETASGSKLFVTSSGVSAGGDAALAVAAHLGGVERARAIAERAEWTWQEDSTHDPFHAD